jgi:two-component system LytT family response regulator
MKILIVDDEAPARQRLRKLLEGEAVEILADCANGDEALDAIAAHAPDLVFLDIQMPGRNGFDVLRDLPADIRPAVVFVTAFDEHAVRAFEFHALDYLLKPFRRERLQQSLERARQITRDKEAGGVSARLEQLLQSLPAAVGMNYPRRLVVKDGARVSIVPVEDIVCLLAEGNYVEICPRAGKRLLMRETMNSLETRLDPARFFRASRSAMVNLSHLKEVLSEGKSGHVLIMANDEKIRLTVPYEQLQQRLT